MSIKYTVEETTGVIIKGDTCSCLNLWPGLPEGFDGREIRNRKVFGPPMTSRPIRLGGSEPKMIVAETNQFVVYRVWSAKGADLGEHVLPKPEFDEEYERRPR